MFGALNQTESRWKFSAHHSVLSDETTPHLPKHAGAERREPKRPKRRPGFFHHLRQSRGPRPRIKTPARRAARATPQNQKIKIFPSIPPQKPTFPQLDARRGSQTRITARSYGGPPCASITPSLNHAPSAPTRALARQKTPTRAINSNRAKRTHRALLHLPG